MEGLIFLQLCLLLVNTGSVKIGASSQSSYLKIFGLQQSQINIDPCYEELSSSSGQSRARKCIPDFVNAAFGKEIQATHTCGAKVPSRMCFLSDGTGVGLIHSPVLLPVQKNSQTRLSSLGNSNNNNNLIGNPGTTSIAGSEVLQQSYSSLESIKIPKPYSGSGININNNYDSSGNKQSGPSSTREFGETETKFFGESDFLQIHSADSPSVPEKITQAPLSTNSRSRNGNRGRNNKNKTHRVVRSTSQHHGGSGHEAKCHICDATDVKRAHPTTFMTDLNNPNNLTCWESNPFALDSENVTLTLSLGKKYELTYVSLQFCGGAKPDSLAIYKSMDFGRSWQPLQYYSSYCKKMYGKPNRATITRANEQEPLCTDSHIRSDSGMGSRIAFSTLEGRPSAIDFDNSPILQDWVTATDIRVVFNRMLTPDKDLASLTQQIASLTTTLSHKEQIFHLLHNDTSMNSVVVDTGTNPMTSSSSDNPADSMYHNGYQANEAQPQINEASAAAEAAASAALINLPSTTTKHNLRTFYSVADFAVGGRCKCNGHASRCIHNKEGELVCDCRHNTAGRDCERCKPFYLDRPWGRATSRDSHECKACQCNSHARRCRFNMELFKLSGRSSGGVCLRCRHNTAGRFCHYCKEGFYRDPTKPVTHRKACKACECHPVGASGRTCNQTTGQCPCKDGVTGLTCNRCAKGYQQSRSPVAPCVKIPKMPEPEPIESVTGRVEEQKYFFSFGFVDVGKHGPNVMWFVFIHISTRYLKYSDGIR
ncbi:unnamed protein product [Allacma fusca]|uniref:Netrin 1 n=1 Tax=Allacma fusca TaxID=39272 RepID=A0A8J2KYM6_9HEXA|nr:unnamed protein product [Allacma fusca]